ncbi:MAG: EAL domain-containing protein [Gallionella sp.]|nr:EAL domain-containing protein [Gallionella sp.]OIO11392.1 MAG: hypothetical protein AUJ80_02325 [Gallionellaceae bacterium CG1_02_60_325]PIV48314.1 MAG: GGDEF domain-containing protein [Gallionellaceae bacterium CG02_land_8_20_14_3_00_60_115]PJC04586.1 MAG: GGDEF domain-containing protein [Gallionellaceae bacterium CG_4_9_14_0_8_um_filter_60_335]
MSTDLSPAAQRELGYKVRFLRLALWLVVLSAGLLGIYRLVVTPLMGMVNMLIAVSSLFFLFLLKRRPEQIERIANMALGAVFVGASLVYLFLYDNTIRLGVFFPFVAGAFYLRGARIGLRWLLATVAVILAGHLLPWFPDAYSAFEIAAACLYLSLLFAVLYNFEKVRSEHFEQEKQLENIAHFDGLTGVPNRMLLADRLAQALARTKREQGLMAVCYLDLDGFKPVNDKYGHQIGDQVLVEVTRRIKETIREDDTVARLGGDEFALLLVGLQVPEECVGSLQRLLETLNQPILLPGISIRISASIGVALYPQDEENAETLLRHADQAMYIAKQAGRNRYHLFDAAHDRRARSHHDLLRGIRRGLARGEFELYYQPKVDLAKRRMVGAEALLRWHHPQRGLLRPDEFLRVIENTELEIELGDWVIGSALAQLCRWRAEGEEFEEFEVSINISAYHLRSADFVHKMQSAMQGCCARACRGCLQIEVLESVALEDIAHVSPIINACREFGVGFVLDDFGTGYSPLTCLSDLAVDGLKIDQSFVRGMLYDRGARAIVQGIIALAQAFERGVVAEGAEQTEQLRVLQEMGCPVVQGNVIALPMPAAELAEWCRREWPPKAD